MNSHDRFVRCEEQIGHRQIAPLPTRSGRSLQVTPMLLP